ESKTYATLAEEVCQQEQSIKNAASALFEILSKPLGEKIGKTNLIIALTRYRDNSQTFDHNNKPQPQQSDKVLELVIEVGIDDLTPEKIDKINNLIQKIARDNTIKPIMKLKGSIRLFLEGSEDGLQRLADLHQSGELQALLNKHKSDDIPEIVVTKAEFTTDAKVIEKAELIKAIREGTSDKTTLQQVDLSGADLRGADLRGAFLRKADLSGANLSDAKLRGADLIEADLIEADLRRAFLSGAILSDANLSGADLSDANLSAAEVKKAIFIDATGITPEQKQDLIRRGAIFGDTSNEASKEINNKLIESIKKPNLPQPIFERTNQKEADLSGADLSGADLSAAILKRADLSAAILIEANLSAAILIEANLSGANLSGAKLRGAILIEADLSGANLKEAILSGANLSGADLRRADLSDANLSAAEVKKAIFIGATGITREQKQDLIRRGAIFGDNSNDRSKVLV
ncbi:MAG: pentapeptide repeat-containing protein, partial [Microcystis sp. M53598_WE2]|uniref:pentapeptide repeat-containing protein n=1 Tax=Microcystis sp. M53598_WE2 TaxID=3030677 RepID=UPI00258BE3E1